MTNREIKSRLAVVVGSFLCAVITSSWGWRDVSTILMALSVGFGLYTMARLHLSKDPDQ